MGFSSRGDVLSLCPGSCPTHTPWRGGCSTAGAGGASPRGQRARRFRARGRRRLALPSRTIDCVCPPRGGARRCMFPVGTWAFEGRCRWRRRVFSHRGSRCGTSVTKAYLSEARARGEERRSVDIVKNSMGKHQDWGPQSQCPNSQLQTKWQ